MFLIVSSGLIQFIGDKGQSVDIGIFFGLLLLLLTIMKIFTLENYYNHVWIAGARVRNSLTKAIYKNLGIGH